MLEHVGALFNYHYIFHHTGTLHSTVENHHVSTW